MEKRFAFAIVAGMLLAAVPVAAQAQSSEGWHANGTLGMDLDQTTQISLMPGSALDSSQNYNSAGGDLGLNLSGYAFNPLFLPFFLSFDGEHGSNSLATTGYHDNIFAGTFSTTLLPAKPYSLRFYYTNTNFAATGNTFGENNSNSTLGAEWNLLVPKFPHLNVGYSRSGNDVHMPTSLFNTTYKQDHAYANAQDTWASWLWSGGFDNYDDTSFLPTGLGPSGTYQETLRLFGGRLERPFWSKKAVFHVENRVQWLDEVFAGQPETTSSEIYTSASLRIQHTRKLSTNYFYTLDRITSPTVPTPVLSAGVQLLVPPTFLSHYAGAQVDYRATKHINLFEQGDYQHITPGSNLVESRESFTELLSGADLTTTWHRTDLSGQYIGHLQFMGTNFDNRTHTFSNEAHGRASRGDPSSIRLEVYGDYSKLNLVDELNGFAENHRVGVGAEKTWLGNTRWRVSVGRSYVEMLNLSGDVHQSGTDIEAQMDQTRFSLGYTHSLTAGAGALFPEALSLRTLISIPLPLSDLVATPLLADTTRLDAGTLILRLHRNLDLSGDLRQERDYLATTNFSFREAEARLHYRLGKFTVEGGYGHFIDDTISNSLLSGLHTNEYRLRVARDFRLF